MFPHVPEWITATEFENHYRLTVTDTDGRTIGLAVLKPVTQPECETALDMLSERAGKIGQFISWHQQQTENKPLADG